VFGIGPVCCLLQRDGWTPLHLACYSRMPAVVVALLDAGAAVDVTNVGGLHWVGSTTPISNPDPSAPTRIPVRHTHPSAPQASHPTNVSPHSWLPLVLVPRSLSSVQHSLILLRNGLVEVCTSMMCVSLLDSPRAIPLSSSLQSWVTWSACVPCWTVMPTSTMHPWSM
jgi:hypothetical protein